MDVLEAIRSRRGTGKVKSDPVNIKLLEQILDAATNAPNHYATEPWRFFVLSGEGRRPLGRVLADIERESMDDPAAPENMRKLTTQEAKPFRAPVVIAAAAVISDDPRVFASEEKAAVSAAIQNMLLAAHALGLGAIWRTGHQTYHPKMKELFGLREVDALLGFIYIGHPEVTPPPRKRTPFADKTVWVGQDVQSFT